MKSISKTLCLLTLLIIAACTHKNKTTNTPNAAIKPKADSTISHSSSYYQNDTSYPLKINNESCRLTLTHDEFRCPSDSGMPTITIRIIKEATNDTLLLKTLCFNYFDKLEEPIPGQYWISFLLSAGGSGFAGTIFRIKTISQAVLQPVSNYGATDSWILSKSPNTLLLFNSIWGFDEDSMPESHFAPHRQIVSLYKIENDKVSIKKLGTTRLKYDSFQNDSSFIDFWKQEPALVKKIRLNGFK